MRPKPNVVYLHQTGYEDAFGVGDDGISAGIEYTRDILKRHARIFQPAEYILGALWGDDDRKVAEFYGWNEALQNWHGNPTFVDAWVFVDGKFVQRPKSKGCGEMSIAFGREEEHRRYVCVGMTDFIDDATAPEWPSRIWVNPGHPRLLSY